MDDLQRMAELELTKNLLQVWIWKKKNLNNSIILFSICFFFLNLMNKWMSDLSIDRLHERKKYSQINAVVKRVNDRTKESTQDWTKEETNERTKQTNKGMNEWVNEWLLPRFDYCDTKSTFAVLVWIYLEHSFLTLRHVLSAKISISFFISIAVSPFLSSLAVFVFSCVCQFVCVYVIYFDYHSDCPCVFVMFSCRFVTIRFFHFGHSKCCMFVSRVVQWHIGNVVGPQPRGSWIETKLCHVCIFPINLLNNTYTNTYTNTSANTITTKMETTNTNINTTTNRTRTTHKNTDTYI